MTTITAAPASPGWFFAKGAHAAAVALTTFLFVLLFAGSAEAKSPIYSYEVHASTSQAGGHPDLEIHFAVGNRSTQGFPDPCFCNDPKFVFSHVSRGVIGNTHVAPRCTTAQFAKLQCPAESQLGIQAVLLYGPLDEEGVWTFQPLYNMVPQVGQPGLIAFNAPFVGTPIFVELAARTEGDFGLDARTYGIERVVPIYKFSQFLWGVPASPAHDTLRGASGSTCEWKEILPDLREGLYPESCLNGYPPPEPKPSNSPMRPFMSVATACEGPLPTSLATLSFDHGTDYAETLMAPLTGCDQLTFNPSLSAKPTTSEADAPSGLDIDLTVPQLQSPTTPTPSQIEASTVTLPPGVTLNPSAVDGKTSCTDAEAMIGTREESQCPEFSKIGTTTIDSSALPEPIHGYIYIGEPRPGNRYRVIVTADGFSTHIKLLGSTFPDPETGQLVTKFENLPQSPLTEFKMHFFGSERGLLATPDQCGTYAVRSTFKPWDAALPDQRATQFFDVDSGPTGAPCPSSPPGFEPRFSAASASNAAGAHRPFTVTLERDDGDQFLAGLNVTTPPGFSATLKGIPYCPESALTQLERGEAYSGVTEQISPACPQASQVGVATTAVGAGSRPVYIGGKVYLAGPYKGAPLSLEVVVPAVSGPYDLGTVAVRAAVYVDPVTAEVHTVSDPLPQIFGGVPLRARFLRVDLDRPDFALNPTNCDPHQVTADVAGDAGARATRGAHYQVANCSLLPYEPKLTMRLSGGVKRRGHPAIHSVLTTKPGEANSKEVVVTLPKKELLDSQHIGTSCIKADFEAGTCPAGSLLGEAEATSPLLDKPLRGKVYLRSSTHKLPDISVDLRGQIDVVVTGRVSAVDGRLRVSFESLPDVPVSRFVLDLLGGKKGLLNNSESLCDAKKNASVVKVGQNGVRKKSQTRLQVVGCGGKKASKRHSQGRGA